MALFPQEHVGKGTPDYNNSQYAENEDQIIVAADSQGKLAGPGMNT